MKNMFKKFNDRNTLLVITSYPLPGKNSKSRKHGFNAVAWHSERLLRALSKNRKVLVCAEKTGKRKYFAPNSNTLVTRVWEKGNLLSFLTLFRFIIKHNEIKSILVQFEFNVFGGILPNLVILFELGLLRLFGKHITFEVHQVITDIKKLEKHIHITNPLIQKFFNISLKCFYFILGLVVNNIIVFEQELKDKLSSYVNEDKIHVFSLAVEKGKITPPNKAIPVINKKLLSVKNMVKKNEFVLLVFGFINGYKGIDWIVNILKDIKGQNIRLLVAGGQNPYLKDKIEYQKFYNSIVSELQKHNHMTHTGFIPDSDIHFYFAASDLVVMPYEVFMSASGPFSHALSYNKPIIISEKLAPYVKSADFKSALAASDLSIRDLVFKLTKKDLLYTVRKARDNKKYYQNLTTFSKVLGSLRSMEYVSQKLDRLLFTPVESKNLVAISTRLAWIKSFARMRI